MPKEDQGKDFLETCIREIQTYNATQIDLKNKDELIGELRTNLENSKKSYNALRQENIQLTNRLKPKSGHLGYKGLFLACSVAMTIGIGIGYSISYFNGEPTEPEQELSVETSINRDFAAIHPWASCPSKIWPQQKIVELLG